MSQIGDTRYYSYLGEVRANRGLPLLPRFSFGVSIPGAKTQGVLFGGGVYSDVLAAPITTTAIIFDHAQLDTSSGYVLNQWYPSVLELVNQLAGGGADRLTTSLGQMHRDIGESGAVLTPAQHLYNQVGFEVYYYNRYAGNVPDRTPPHVTNVRLTPNANQVQASVAVTDVKGLNDAAALGVWRVVVAYTVNTPAGTGQ